MEQPLMGMSLNPLQAPSVAPYATAPMTMPYPSQYHLPPLTPTLPDPYRTQATLRTSLPTGLPATVPHTSLPAVLPASSLSVRQFGTSAQQPSQWSGVTPSTLPQSIASTPHLVTQELNSNIVPQGYSNLGVPTMMGYPSGNIQPDISQTLPLQTETPMAVFSSVATSAQGLAPSPNMTSSESAIITNEPPQPLTANDEHQASDLKQRVLSMQEQLMQMQEIERRLQNNENEEEEEDGESYETTDEESST
jgi:hypothetical protein